MMMERRASLLKLESQHGGRRQSRYHSRASASVADDMCVAFVDTEFCIHAEVTSVSIPDKRSSTYLIRASMHVTVADISNDTFAFQNYRPIRSFFEGGIGRLPLSNAARYDSFFFGNSPATDMIVKPNICLQASTQ